MSNGKGKQALCEPVYIASGCNRYSNVADVREQDGLVVYGAGKLVALWKSEVSDRVFRQLDHYALHTYAS